MRDIKLRAWDKEKEEWAGADYWYEGVGLNFNVTPPSALTMSGKETHVLMQYTGLKDKNGVEIYEGDVVKLDKKQHGDSDWSVNAVVKYDETPLFDTSGKEVEDYYNGWNIHSKGNEIIANRAVLPLNSIWADYFGLQIIGSVYENPELLEVELIG